MECLIFWHIHNTWLFQYLGCFVDQKLVDGVCKCPNDKVVKNGACSCLREGEIYVNSTCICPGAQEIKIVNKVPICSYKKGERLNLIIH